MTIAACSHNNGESSSYDQVESKQMSKEEEIVAEEGASDSIQPQRNTNLSSADERKVMYHANIRVEVAEHEKTMNHLQREAKELGGYMIHSNNTEMDDKIEGYLTFRIPEEHFQRFVQLIKESSKQVLSEQISGNDVTEEYVDLQSRLTSKEVVENRLIEFMNSAEKTEDLLKISNELERVQAEIEQLKGRIKYIENKTALSTIDVHWVEEKMDVPDLNSKELNTFEKTKKQLMTSVNWLLSAFSWTVVFLIGNLPIFILVSLVILIFWKGRKKFKHFTKKSSNNTED